MTTPRILFDTEHCSQVAPAGYGKTHLITEAVALASDKPQLILTHTHAGVNAIRERLRKQEVDSSKYQVETLDGWALKWATAYPEKSGVNNAECVMTIDWDTVRTGVLNIITCDFFKAVISSSYAGVFVDEYQDCGPEQHQLVTTLCNALPVRVLGDPLQGIFDFGNNNIVDWATDVESSFPPLEELSTPWRWQNINPNLGDTLALVRQQIVAGAEIDFNQPDFSAISMHTTDDVTTLSRDIFFQTLRRASAGERIAVLFPYKTQSRSFARQIGGRASAIETVECEELIEATDDIWSKNGVERGLAIVELLKSCMTRIGAVLATPIRQLNNGQLPNTNRMRTFVVEATALKNAIESDEATHFHNFIKTIEAAEGVVTFRKEFVSRLKRALLGCCADSELTITDSLAEIREQDRFRGTRSSGHIVGTTLLLKGLEFDHVILVNAQQLNSKNLYVALTRGTKSVTIIDRSSVFNTA